MIKSIRRSLAALLCMLLCFSVLTACADSSLTELEENPVALAEYAAAKGSQTALSADTADLAAEASALTTASAALPQKITAVASGVYVRENDSALIDYSNASEGYVMVQYKQPSTQRLKVQVKGPATTYTYNLTAEQWVSLPLSDGNGNYKITVYRNVSGSKYASVLSLSTKVELQDEFAPFLHSNQYVDFDAAPKTVEKAAELTKDLSVPLEKVAAVYDYVVKNTTYDRKLAATVKSGYLPVLDEVLEKKSGICFDYAALMTGMLRSQDIPCKLVVGYAGQAYHAWISVWSAETGWIDGAIYFNGSSWQRMDPTFASSAKSSKAIMAYIGDGKNYSAKYFY